MSHLSGIHTQDPSSTANAGGESPRVATLSNIFEQGESYILWRFLSKCIASDSFIVNILESRLCP